jgi:hypothetical protein
MFAIDTHPHSFYFLSSSKHQNINMNDFFSDVEMYVEDILEFPQDSMLSIPLPKELIDQFRIDQFRKDEGKFIDVFQEKIDELKTQIMEITLKDSDCLEFYDYLDVSKEMDVDPPVKIVKVKTMSTQTETTCNCVSSKCSKKYCPCFSAGGKCGPKCRCDNCMNQ